MMKWRTSHLETYRLTKSSIWLEGCVSNGLAQIAACSAIVGEKCREHRKGLEGNLHFDVSIRGSGLVTD